MSCTVAATRLTGFPRHGLAIIPDKGCGRHLRAVTPRAAAGNDPAAPVLQRRWCRRVTPVGTAFVAAAAFAAPKTNQTPLELAHSLHDSHETFRPLTGRIELAVLHLSRWGWHRPVLRHPWVRHQVDAAPAGGHHGCYVVGIPTTWRSVRFAGVQQGAGQRQSSFWLLMHVSW